MVDADPLEAAWSAVFDVLPTGWSVPKPVDHPERGYWVAYAHNNRFRKLGIPFVEAAGPTEELALRDLAKNIAEALRGEGPWKAV